MKKRTCDHAMCEHEGAYRAPKARHALREYYWFCLEHVKEYNKNWNYFDGMNEEEIALAIHAKDRGLDEIKDRVELHIEDSVIRNEFSKMWQSEDDRGRARYDIMMDVEIERGLEVLGLRKREVLEKISEEQEGHISKEEVNRLILAIVRKRYRELAKVMHPDMQNDGGDNNGGDNNGGDGDFKQINSVYTMLCRRLSGDD